MSQVNSKTGGLDLDHQDQLAFILQHFSEKKLKLFFIAPSNLHRALNKHLLVQSRGVLGRYSLIWLMWAVKPFKLDPYS